jgi:hypothetical protein
MPVFMLNRTGVILYTGYNSLELDRNTLRLLQRDPNFMLLQCRYGMAKAAVHQLTKSLGSANSGLPEGRATHYKIFMLRRKYTAYR